MILKGGKVFDTKFGFVERDLHISGERITNISKGKEINVSGNYIIPGLTDLHFHGCIGKDISDGEIDGLTEMAKYELKNGITQICPTSMSLPIDRLIKVCKMVKRFKELNLNYDFVGINLEGPFLSNEKCGAHNPEFLELPDINLFDKLYDFSGSIIKLITVSPELPGAIEFIKYVSKKVIVSLGHTTADYELAHRAIEVGAKQLTHMFNAMSPLLHREPGLIGAAVDNKNTFVELICDGIHIHPSVIRIAFQIFGGDRIILVSDSMRATGLKDGTYDLGGQQVTVKGKRAVLADNTIAGSATNLFECMRKSIEFGVDPFDAIKAATVNPAKVLDIYNDFGSLEIGKFANILILNEKFELKEVIFHGEFIN